MKVLTVLEKHGLVTEREHLDLDQGFLFCRVLYENEVEPFVLTLYRYRHFRGDSYPSREKMAVWIKGSLPDAQSHPEDRWRTDASAGPPTESAHQA